MFDVLQFLEQPTVNQHISDIHAAITEANRQFVEAFNRGDAAGVAALYTRTGHVLRPGSAPVSSAENLAAFWLETGGRAVEAAP